MSPDPEPMAEPTTDAADPRDAAVLIACSRERTLIARRSVDGASMELVKIYEHGTLEDAAAEAAMGALLQVEGVVRYHGAGRDPLMGKPCVTMDFHTGMDLERWLGAHGPAPPHAAARVALAIVEAVARMHAVSVPEAPRGVVHRDLKPGNVFLVGADDDIESAEVLLVDLEHAVAMGAPAGSGGVFTGGTHGYSPPEAYAGVEPGPAFDVFGFGATLHALLTGRPPFDAAEETAMERSLRVGRRPRWCLWGLPERLVELLDRCLAARPEDRPTIAEIHRGLSAYLDDHGPADESLDRARSALSRGEIDAARAELERTPDSPRRRELERLARRLGRVTAKIAPPAEPPTLAGGSDPRTVAEGLAATAPRLVSWLARFPAAPRELALSARLRDELRALLEQTPAAIAEHKRDGAFDAAQELLAATLRAVRAVGDLPAAPTPPPADNGLIPGPMLRDPMRYLRLALEDLRATVRAHSGLTDELVEAETELDLARAEGVLESAASTYSGATGVVAQLKDRIHRLGFYLERIAQPVEALGQLEAQLKATGVSVDLAPLRELQRRCERSIRHHGRGNEVPVEDSGLRAFRRTLHLLVDEFPATETAVRPGMAALDSAFEHLTDHGWSQLDDAETRLDAVPIPIRPLTATVHRLDALRRLDVIIDRPAFTRAMLIDRHERLRMRIDQARATRDRIARGAQEDLARGHITTALFDMERAADQFGAETGELASGLEEARRRKLEVDETARRARELATRIDQLEQDPAADPDARLALLQQRRDALAFLVENLPIERAEPFANDLRAVDEAMAELAAQRPRPERPRTPDAVAIAGRDRRLPATVLVPAVVVVAVIGAWFGGVFDRFAGAGALADQLSGMLRAPFAPATGPGGATFDQDQACTALREFVAVLERDPIPGEDFAAVVAAARRISESVDTVARRDEGFVMDAWRRAFESELSEFEERLRDLEQRLDGLHRGREVAAHLRRYHLRALEAGLLVAAAGAQSDQDRRALRPLRDAATWLAPATREFLDQRLRD